MKIIYSKIYIYITSTSLTPSFQQNTVKLSYSCTMNMDTIIKAHNAKILKKEEKVAKTAREPATAETKQDAQLPTVA